MYIILSTYHICDIAPTAKRSLLDYLDWFVPIRRSKLVYK